MRDPAVLRWQLPGPVNDAAGGLVKCPGCRRSYPLTIAMDLEDWSDEPSYLTCQQGHTWAEPGVPRWVGADLLRLIFEAEPGLAERLDTLREISAERGRSN